MGRLVREGMEQGAVGLSSGLDYIPSRYADTEELIALCREMAPFGGVYVTHMRRYDPEGVRGSMDEVFRIGREAGVAVHISHFNSRADLALPKVDAGRAEGIDVTYRPVLLPGRQLDPGHGDACRRLGAGRRRGRDRCAACATRPCANGCASAFATRARHWRRSASATWPHPSTGSYEGQTLDEAAPRQPGRSVGEFICDVLVGLGHGGRLRRAAPQAHRGGRAAADAPPGDDGRQRRHLHRQPPAPARLRLLRPLPGPSRPRRAPGRWSRPCSTWPPTPPGASG